MKVKSTWTLLLFITFVCNGHFTEQTVLPGDDDTQKNSTSSSRQKPDHSKKKQETNGTFPLNNSSDYDNNLAVPILPNVQNDDQREDEIQVFGRTALLCKGSICSDSAFPDIAVHCYCDVHCILFGDCCVDYFQKLVQTSAKEAAINTLISDPVEFYRTNTSAQASVDDNIKLMVEGECHELYRSQAFSVILIKRCPYSESVGTFEWLLGCMDPYADFPVTRKVSTDIQIVYKNKYCAFCNGLSEHELLYWKVQAGCPDDIVFGTNDVQSTIYDKCKLLYKAPNMSAQPRYCLSHSIFSHPFILSESVAFNLCKRYVAPFADYHGIFQNPHCNPSAELDTGQARCIKSLIDIIFIAFNPVELIFNFDINNGIWQLYQPGDNTCHSGLKIQGVCQILTNIFYVTNATLPVESDKGVFTSNSILLDFRFKNMDETNKSSTYVQKAEVEWKNKLSVWDVHSVSSASSVKTTVDQDHFLLHVRGDESSFIGNVMHILEHDLESTMTIKMTNYQDIESLRCEENSRLVKSTRVAFDTKRYSVIHLMDSFMSVFIEYARFTIYINKAETPVIRETFVCQEVPVNLSCKYIALDSRSYSVENETIFLVTNHDRRELVVDNELRNDVLYVCVDIDVASLSVFDILDTLAVCLSILSLLVLLILNCIYPSLLNLPGKILFSFALTLLLSLILLATMNISNKTDLSCKVVAIMSHYLWLCVFHWSAIMAYEFARMFGSKMLRNIQNSNAYRFHVYAAIAYGFPVLIVTVCIVLDQTNTPLSIGYGVNGVCWIYESMARMIFVISPIGVILVVGMISLIIAIHGIQTSDNDIAHLSQTRHNRRKCLIFSKLFFLLGLTWLLTFITPFTKNRALIYVSMFLNSLQGFFLFLIFAVNSRFITLVRKTFQKKKASSATSSNNVHSFDQI